MGTQGADDAGRELDPPWLGPKGIRWPVDWSVKKWVTFGVVTNVAAMAFAFVLPLALVLGVLAGAGGRSAGRLIDADRPRRWTFAVVIPVLGLVLLLVPLRALALPMPLLLVPFAAVASGFWFTRLYGRLLDWNRPIGFYLRMPRLVAAGPRLRPEREVDPARLVLTAGPDADRRDYEPVHKVTSDGFEVQDTRHKIQNILEEKTRQRLGNVDMGVSQINGASHTSFRRTGSVTVPKVTVTNTVPPHHWTGDEIEPGKLIYTHDRIPSTVEVETTLAERDAAVETFVEQLMTSGHIPANLPPTGVPPKRPRWIRTVPGGIQIGHLVLDFTVKETR